MKHRGLIDREVVFVFAMLAIMAWIVFPVFIRARHNARRQICESNLKKLSMAFMSYASDNNDLLPLRSWVAPVSVYLKSPQIFHCPETDETPNTSDYFFNARFQNKPLGSIKSPATLVLFGDGQDDAPLDATLTQFPAAWRSDEKSPSFRHLGMANYLFADGHVKALKVNRVSRDFRMVLK